MVQEPAHTQASVSYQFKHTNITLSDWFFNYLLLLGYHIGTVTNINLILENAFIGKLLYPIQSDYNVSIYAHV
jgi:hypothetical protein